MLADKTACSAKRAERNIFSFTGVLELVGNPLVFLKFIESLTTESDPATDGFCAY